MARSVSELALTVWMLCTLAGCVQTAECDATVPCATGLVCYDYMCRRTCELDDDCGAGALCAPCQQDDAQGTVDHCFEATLFACVAETAE